MTENALNSRTAAQYGRLLARGQLTYRFGQIYLHRQSAPEGAAHACAREAHATRTLGHYTGAELHLSTLESSDQEI